MKKGIGETSDAGAIPTAPPIKTEIHNYHCNQSGGEQYHGTSNSTIEKNIINDLYEKSNGDINKILQWVTELGLNYTYNDINNYINFKKNNEDKEDDIDTIASQLGAPEMFFCPISFHLLRDPVIVPETGQTYERNVIEKWFKECNLTCPITGIQLRHPVNLTPNVALRKSIEEWAENNASYILGKNGKLLPVSSPVARKITENSEIKYPSLKEKQVSVDADMAYAINLQQIEMQPIHVIQERPRRKIKSVYEMVADEIEIQEEKRSIKCKRLSYVITLLYIAYYLYILFQSEMKIEDIHKNPLLGFSRDLISNYGGTNAQLIKEDNEWWRLFSSMIATAGIVHLMWILVSISLFVHYISRSISYKSLALLFLMSGLSGIIFSANFNNLHVTAGASCAIFGLIGCVLVDLILTRYSFLTTFFRFTFTFILAFLGIVLGLTPFVDNWSNIGGFITGTLIAISLILTHKGKKEGNVNYCLEIIFIIIQVIMMGLSITIILLGAIAINSNSDITENCKWCHNMNCISFINHFKWECEASLILPNHCSYEIKGNLTTIITCPTGEINEIEINDLDQEILDSYCTQYCKLDDTEHKETVTHLIIDDSENNNNSNSEDENPVDDDDDVPFSGSETSSSRKGSS